MCRWHVCRLGLHYSRRLYAFVNIGKGVCIFLVRQSYVIGIFGGEN